MSHGALFTGRRRRRQGTRVFIVAGGAECLAAARLRKRRVRESATIESPIDIVGNHDKLRRYITKKLGGGWTGPSWLWIDFAVGLILASSSLFWLGFRLRHCPCRRDRQGRLDGVIAGNADPPPAVQGILPQCPPLPHPSRERQKGTPLLRVSH